MEEKIKTKKCKCCGHMSEATEFGYQKKECRVCDYLNTHKDNNILKLSEENYKKVLSLMLNGKLNYINDLCDMFSISLDNAILSIKTIGTRNGRNKNSYIIKCKCDQCNKDIETSIFKYENTPIHFCNRECQNEYKKGKHIISQEEYNNCTCDWCKKEFHRKKSHIEKDGSNTCSKECSREYYKNVVAKTEKHIERGREIALTNLKNGVYKTDSSIQLIINDLLSKLNINYENEYTFGKYSFDNYLNEYNLFIEVMGGYWHSDPRNYDKINYKSQKDSIRRDKSKRTYAKNKGINILYLWEKDINENLELCRELIKSFIENNGILQDYNSFNYSLTESNLQLNSIKIKPYIDYTSEELRNIVDLSVKLSKDYYITFNCDECGKEVTRLKSKYGEYDKHFCSVKCRNNNRKKDLLENNNVKCNCDFCGEDINKKLHQYNYHKKHFCSKECYDNYQARGKTIKICECCGKDILLNAIQVKRNKSGIFFCSQECYKQDKKEKSINNVIKYKCDYCEKDCETSKYKYNKYLTHFCSVKCSNTFRNKNKLKETQENAKLNQAI